MKKQSKRKHRRRSNGTAEIRLLQDMNATLARMEDRLDVVGDLSIRQGAIAGAAAGGLVSVVVSVTLLYLKLRHGV
ncbi:hypothetical protein [Trabulsiella odontotermitis]|uniref:Uncharacterized protein n=1 Tax=Trabulsiella odontotermitis TaxID=379893 RepID=A0A0L0GZA2_9ENTR|nr:hypothetical protein [Trabulsiella odontotermitis]KNC93798.1 hypothetical protein GM31_17960 [Trabulsiella odontotermitis]